MDSIKRINTRQELVQLAREVGVQPDWHEPDNQSLDAVAFGGNFDNAGFWGLRHLSERELAQRCRLSNESDTTDSAIIDIDEAHLFTEMFIVLYRDNRAIAEINLATLFAFACGYEGN
jgi:hypothetical protein